MKESIPITFSIILKMPLNTPYNCLYISLNFSNVTCVFELFLGNLLSILSVVLCGCETWFLTLWEELRLRVFEKRIQRRIFEPKRDANGEWRRLYNEELHSLYRSPNIVRVIKPKD